MHAIVTALAAGILGGTDRPDAPPWLPAAVADLRAAGPRALVHAGPDLPAEAHALVHQVNERLGGRGTTFDLIEPVAHRPEDEAASMAALMDDMRDGRVETLLILDGNPVYAAPRLPRGAARMCRSACPAPPRPTKPRRAATWHVPQTHVFEAWGDIRAHDGTVTIQQPQALPLYGGHERAGGAGAARASARRSAAATWCGRPGASGWTTTAWQDALATGVVPGTASAVVADRSRLPLTARQRCQRRRRVT